MNSDGSGQVQISGASQSGGTWSPDGSKLLFAENTGSIKKTVAVNSTNGGGKRTVYNGNLVSPSWGPDYQFSTPTGSNVPVDAGGATVTFGGVSTAGTTTFTPMTTSNAGTAPNGFILGGLAYEISTTAAYRSPVTVCFNVPTTFAPTIASFNVLALMHNEGGILVDRTTSRNFGTRQICGTVTTLSPFALAEQVDTNLPAITGLIEDSNGNPWATYRCN